jgi:hypothetical protein
MKAIWHLENTIEISKSVYGLDHRLTLKYLKELERIVMKVKFEE